LRDSGDWASVARADDDVDEDLMSRAAEYGGI